MNNQSLVAPSQETTRLESAPATAPDSNEDINDVYNI